MSADYSPAIWMPSPGRYWQGRSGHTPKWIILHGTAGGTSAQAVGNWLNTQTEREATSVHYVIGVDGAVVQLVSEHDSAWGNGVTSAGDDAWWNGTGNPNYVTFSIEHCKPHVDNSDVLSPAQREASFLLVRHLCERYNIPRHKADASGGITGHFSIDPVDRHNCPGPYPWADLWAYLNGGSGVVNTAGLGSGDAKEAIAEGSSVAIPETYFGHQSVATLQDGTGLYWDGATVHALRGAAPAFKLLLDDRAALLQQITQLKAQLAAAQASQEEHQALVQIKAIADRVA